MSAIQLVADRELSQSAAEEPTRVRRLAIIAAVLLHVSIPVSQLVDLSWSKPAPAVPSIPVTLILTPPSVPPDVDKPAKPTAKYRESGPDDHTAGPATPPVPPIPLPQDKPSPPPPPAPEQAAQEEHPPPAPAAEAAKPVESASAETLPPPPAAIPDAVPVPAPKAPEPPKAQETPRAPEPPTKPVEAPQAKERSPTKEQTPPHAPTRTAAARPAPRPPVLNREEAPRETSGDPYLNLISREAARHHVYPPLAMPLKLSGKVTYEILIDRGGRLRALRLVESSGSELLDKQGAREIQETAPFPAPPSDDYLDITWTVTFDPPN